MPSWPQIILVISHIPPYRRTFKRNSTVYFFLCPWRKKERKKERKTHRNPALSLLQFWSAYVPCSSQHLDSVQLALEQIDLIRRLVNKHPESMVLVTTAEGEAFRLQFYAFVTPAIQPVRRNTMSGFAGDIYTRWSFQSARRRNGGVEERKKGDWQTEIIAASFFDVEQQSKDQEWQNEERVRYRVKHCSIREDKFSIARRPFGTEPNRLDFSCRVNRYRYRSLKNFPRQTARPIFSFPSFFSFFLLSFLCPTREGEEEGNEPLSTGGDDYRATSAYKPTPTPTNTAYRSGNAPFVCSLNKFRVRTTTHYTLFGLLDNWFKACIKSSAKVNKQRRATPIEQHAKHPRGPTNSPFNRIVKLLGKLNTELLIANRVYNVM